MESFDKIPGLYVQKEVLTTDHEEKIIQDLDHMKWSDELSRRTIHQGYRYPYSRGGLIKIEPISGIFSYLAKYLYDNHVMSNTKDVDDRVYPDQVIINEYLKDQGIGAHVDRQDFGPIVVAFSLNADTNMIFRNVETKEKTEIYVPRRSILIMSGESRNKFTHEIPRRKTVLTPDGNVTKGEDYRRVSITYRTVNS